ncbi:hypothetical protein JOE48_005871 [Methylobacterium sp. PvR107]|nr:hypothetical protein [Methylobacterium sp. PvR107]
MSPGPQVPRREGRPCHPVRARNSPVSSCGVGPGGCPASGKRLTKRPCRGPRPWIAPVRRAPCQHPLISACPSGKAMRSDAGGTPVRSLLSL